MLTLCVLLWQVCQHADSQQGIYPNTTLKTVLNLLQLFLPLLTPESKACYAVVFVGLPELEAP